MRRRDIMKLQKIALSAAILAAFAVRLTFAADIIEPPGNYVIEQPDCTVATSTAFLSGWLDGGYGVVFPDGTQFFNSKEASNGQRWLWNHLRFNHLIHNLKPGKNEIRLVFVKRDRRDGEKVVNLTYDPNLRPRRGQPSLGASNADFGPVIAAASRLPIRV